MKHLSRPWHQLTLQAGVRKEGSRGRTEEKESIRDDDTTKITGKEGSHYQKEQGKESKESAVSQAQDGMMLTYQKEVLSASTSTITG